MIFNSLQYALFLPLVVGLHWLLHGRARTALLLVASRLLRIHGHCQAVQRNRIDPVHLLPVLKEKRVRPNSKTFAWAVVGPLAASLGVELTLRAASSALPEPIDYYDAVAQAKVEQMELLARHKSRVDIVFAGTSMGFRGIDVATLRKHDGRRRTGYNVGLQGGVPPIMERWLLEEAARPTMR